MQNAATWPPETLRQDRLPSRSHASVERCGIMKHAEINPNPTMPAGVLPFWRRPISPLRFAALVLASAAIIGATALGVYQYQKSQYDLAAASARPSGGSLLPAPAAFTVDEETFSLIPKDEILGGGPPKDGIPALTDPDVVPAHEAGLSPQDRVIGVAIGGEARAYPLRILNWHEIANDVLGGRPIAVTYCPLCDSSLVLDRDIGGEVREFGVSGLLYNSNVLMYDRQETEEQASLWSQMLFKAVAGPAAEEGLGFDLVPAQVTTWEAWLADHPDTTSLSFDTGFARDYGNNPYERYFATDSLMFPVVPVGEAASDTGERAPKEPVLIVSHDGRLKGYPASALAAALDESADSATDQFAGLELHFRPIDVERGIYEVTNADGQPVPIAQSFWFEFRAMHPEAEVFQPAGSGVSDGAGARVHPAKEDTFEALVLEASEPVLVDFWAEWCGICRRLKPVVQAIAQDRAGALSVVSVEVDQQPAIAERYNVSSVPTLALFVDGELIARRNGYVDEAGLAEFLDNNGAGRRSRQRARGGSTGLWLLRSGFVVAVKGSGQQPGHGLMILHVGKLLKAEHNLVRLVAQAVTPEDSVPY